MQEVFEKIIEKLEERTSFLSDCTKYGNNNAEQLEKSYSTMMMYEVADLVDDLIEIVKQEAEQYEECYKDCGDCEAYNKEKHHCPKFCKVIKETVKEIEENHNGWISVKERLPEKEGSYLVIGKSGGAVVTRWYEPSKFYPNGHFGGNCSNYIRYWMPRPEPPQTYQQKG